VTFLATGSVGSVVSAGSSLSSTGVVGAVVSVGVAVVPPQAVRIRPKTMSTDNTK